MVRKFMAIAAILLSGSASAQTADDEKACEGDGMIAGIFMGQRQYVGDNLSIMMKKFGSVPGFREMILQAYEYPVMLTPQTRKLAVSEFKNKWTLRCYREGSALPRKTEP